MIIEEWARITKTIKADILVLDMPLLDTRVETKNLVGRFISDILLQILSFVAENERINIKKRRAEGINLAKEKGIKFGRPKKILDDYLNNKISGKNASSFLGISRGTFYRLVKERKIKKNF